MNNISQRVSETKLFKDRHILGISFVYETSDTAVFERCDTDDLINDYYLLEVFMTGQILVTDRDGVVIDKTDRILNLFRLNV